MALVLSVVKYDEIYAGDVCIKVQEVFKNGDAEVIVGTARFRVKESHTVEVIPGIHLSTGFNRMNPRQTKLVIKAPDDVVILRGPKYYAVKADAHIPARA